MSTVSAESGLTIPPDARDVFPELDKRFSGEGVKLVERALTTTAVAHGNQRRRSGDLYLTHPIAVAQILFELQMDATTVCAGLLHDTLEDTLLTEKRLEADFGAAVTDLVQGVTKISSIHGRSKRRRQVESLRKMILAMSHDIRVVIIKLADRLHNMRTLKWLDPPDRIRIATDTLDIYAPLASRLGMAQIKSEIEDLAMRWTMPEAYEYVSARMSRGLAQRERHVQASIEFLGNLLDEAGIPHYEISGRPKHFHSIYKKMQAKGLSFEEVFDLTALRIITETVSDCYDAMGLIHAEWRPLPGHINDYIALPKDNLYRSLHTTVIEKTGDIIEIQIRTREMHREAEMGVAAHWKYKEGHDQEHELDEKLKWLRQLVEWIQDVQDPGEFLDALKGEVFAQSVFCFTPNGDVIELPAGSTVIDFAYRIHTQVGHTCRGARINRRMVQLRTEIKSGDVIEIITSKSGNPSRDWLEFAKTNRARNKIRHWLRTQHHESDSSLGREMLIRAMRGRSISVTVDQLTERLAPHLPAFRAKSFDDLCAMIGFGSLSTTQVISKIVERGPTHQEEKPTPPAPPSQPRVSSSTDGVRVAGLGNTLVRFSRCCMPVPGDRVVGFVTRGRGVSIHKASCSNVQRMLTTPHNADRIVDVEWDSSANIPRQIDVRIVARDRTGLLADVTHAINERGIFIEESSSRSKGDGTATLRFSILVRSNNELNAVMERLRNVKGVLDLTRVGEKKKPEKTKRRRKR